MTTEQREPLYASTAKPWLKYYDQKYIDMPLPKCSAFEYLCHQNKNHLSETALEYYGRKFTFAVLFSFFFFSLPKADNFAKKMKAAGQNTLITQKSESMM